MECVIRLANNVVDTETHMCSTVRPSRLPRASNRRIPCLSEIIGVAMIIVSVVRARRAPSRSQLLWLDNNIDKRW